MAKEKTSASMYIREIQRMVNSDIQAVKNGNVDEELLRERIRLVNNPSEPAVVLSLWLAGLSMGLYDDLEVSVKEGEDGPAYVFKPVYFETRPTLAPVLDITIPGPKKELAALPSQAQTAPNLPASAEG